MRFLACFYCLVVCSITSAQVFQIGYGKPAEKPLVKNSVTAVKFGYTSQPLKFDLGTSQDQIALVALNTENEVSSFQLGQGSRPISLAMKDKLYLRDLGWLDLPKRGSSDITLMDDNMRMSTSDTIKRGSTENGSHLSRLTSTWNSDVIIEGAERVQIVHPQPRRQYAGQTRWYLGKRIMENRQLRQSARASVRQSRLMASCSSSTRMLPIRARSCRGG